MVIFHSYVSLPEGKKIDEGKVDVWTPDGPWVRFHWPIPVEDVGQGSSLGQQTNELRRRETLMVVMNTHEQSQNDKLVGGLEHGFYFPIYWE